MPGAGQDKTVAAKMAAPHAGGPQFIAADGERGGGGECGRNKLRPSRLSFKGGISPLRTGAVFGIMFALDLFDVS